MVSMVAIILTSITLMHILFHVPVLQRKIQLLLVILTLPSFIANVLCQLLPAKKNLKGLKPIVELVAILNCGHPVGPADTDHQILELFV
jgi:hypothetical protein